MNDFQNNINNAIFLGDIQKDITYKLFYNYPKISENDIQTNMGECQLNGIILEKYYVFNSEHRLIKLLAFEDKDYLKHWYLTLI